MSRQEWALCTEHISDMYTFIHQNQQQVRQTYHRSTIKANLKKKRRKTHNKKTV